MISLRSRPSAFLSPPPAALLVLVPLVAASSPPAGAAQRLTGEVVYTGEAVHVARGGLRRGTAWLGNVDAVVRALGLGSDHTSALLHVLGNHGDPLSAWIGDAQTASNIEAPDAVRVFEAWVEHDLVDAGLSFLLGLYDLNSEFDVIDAAGLFHNSSFGIGAEYAQSGVTGPSIFPVSSLAARVVWRPRPDWSVHGAVLDGVPGDPGDATATVVHLSAADGALLAGEVAWRPGAGTGGSDAVGRAFAADGGSKVTLGVWYYTRRFEPLLPPHDRADPQESGRPRPGVYALAEGRLRSEADPEQGLSVFARAGWSDPRFHRFGAYTGAGLVYTGLVPGRPDDRAGLGLAVAHNGSEYRDLVEVRDSGRTTARELAVELTYRVEGPGWALQPDLQWVGHPGTDPTVGHALLLGIRGEVGVAF